MKTFKLRRKSKSFVRAVEYWRSMGIILQIKEIIKIEYQTCKYNRY